MFSRRPDRPKEEPRLAPSSRPTELVPVPPSDQAPGVWGSTPMLAGPSAGGPVGAWPGVGPAVASVVAERDHVEGTLRSSQGVLILGSLSGTIESETWVRTGEGSQVKADILAEEVVVAGRFEGRLVARGRLEIASTGHILGDIETPRLLLHEGGTIEGGLYMTGNDEDRATARARRGVVPPEPAREALRSASVRGPGAQTISPRSRGAAATTGAMPAAGPGGVPAAVPGGVTVSGAGTAVVPGAVQAAGPGGVTGAMPAAVPRAVPVPPSEARPAGAGTMAPDGATEASRRS